MRSELNDLRRLKLAEMYERAFEAFVVEVASRIVKDVDLRRELAPLTAPTDRHPERIAEEMARLNARLSEADQAAVEIAALEDVVEVEKAARDFYLANADQVHDPRVAELFRQLAREEDVHYRVARRVLAAAEARIGHVHMPSPPSDFRRVAPGEDAPLREGVSDFGEAARLFRGRGASAPER